MKGRKPKDWRLRCPLDTGTIRRHHIEAGHRREWRRRAHAVDYTQSEKREMAKAGGGTPRGYANHALTD